MRIGVFGATGLLGQHTARAVVAAGHELVVIHRPGSELARLQGLPFQAYSAQLSDPASLRFALSQCEAVVHCAGYVPGHGAVADEVARARQEMAQFCEAAQPSQSKVVVVGAGSALPRHPAGLPADETLRYTTRPSNPNVFVQVKWAIEDEALGHAARGLPLVVGIPAMAIGEYDYGKSSGRLLVGIANQTLPGYVRGLRNVMYAGDAGRGLLACLTRGQSGERYLLAGENLSMDTLVRSIARHAQVPAPRAIPLPLARGLAFLQRARFRLGGPAPSVTDAAIQVIARGQFVSGEKARRELGFVAECSVDQAVARALAFLAGQGLLKPVARVA